MRSSLLLLVTSGCVASAGWLRWTGDREPLGYIPQQTRASKVDEVKGWTPKPTIPPASSPEAYDVLELPRKDVHGRETSNTWLNSQTCGWLAGAFSSAWTCAASATCATNTDNVVACVSGTYSPFFSVCFNFEAYQQGACSDIGPRTGCCQTSSFGECGTLLWTGNPPRSMYRCFTEATIISLNNEPQFVIDASTSTFSATSTPSFSQLSTSTTKAAAPVDTDNEDGEDDDEHHHHSSNVGAIVGGVVGGVAVLAILSGFIAYLTLRKKFSSSGMGNPKHNVVRPSDPSHASSPPPQMAQTESVGGHTGPTSPYPGSKHEGMMYDPVAGRPTYEEVLKQQRQYAAYPAEGGVHLQLGPAQTSPGLNPPSRRLIVELAGGEAPKRHLSNPSELN